MKLIIDTSCFACTDENKKLAMIKTLHQMQMIMKLCITHLDLLARCFIEISYVDWEWLYGCKCLSFHRVSFFQGYSLCIEKLCTRIILAMLITERIHFDQFDPKILSLWKNEMVTERGKYIHRYISKLLYIYIYGTFNSIALIVCELKFYIVFLIW